MSLNDKKKILFVLFGEHQLPKKLIIQRIQKLKYVEKDHVFEDVNPDKPPVHPVWVKGNGINGIVDIKDPLDPVTKANQIRKKFTGLFQAVMTLHVTPKTGMLTVSDDCFREEIEYGISVSDITVSEEDRLEIMLNHRRKNSSSKKGNQK
ncbi:hypothetical protein [Flavobacterium sp.]|jgi:hypothetical protein|uniref:hypothetical protein n=1 Tax=Flavobacterium sp. TaxID=239 RepID=UPI0037C134C7